MRMKNLTHALALAFTLALTALIGVGCSCDEDEFNGKEACQKLVDAVNGVLAGCNEPPVGEAEVCGYGTDSCSEVAYCNPKVDVEACVKRIQQQSCLDVKTAVVSLSECEDLQRNIAASCGPKSGGYEGDDD
ncbi:hypothetical protein [Polyangium jinanense]|uniref:Lipoprotein n=1 Tax=Polyangium jinanense TaxID=2829994 RepID=A0A9X3X2A4_9BACT|nr:hypothetical protein [Polyangium jinanense]MDC3952443.1 hypothetical protein [Polyangium jinanense]MDC3980071.1 hypothetical protein [Polyangium jinanense]